MRERRSRSLARLSHRPRSRSGLATAAYRVYQPCISARRNQCPRSQSLPPSILRARRTSPWRNSHAKRNREVVQRRPGRRHHHPDDGSAHLSSIRAPSSPTARAPSARERKVTYVAESMTSGRAPVTSGSPEVPGQPRSARPWIPLANRTRGASVNDQDVSRLEAEARYARERYQLYRPGASDRSPQIARGCAISALLPRGDSTPPGRTVPEHN